MKKLSISILLSLLFYCSPKRESALPALAYVLLNTPAETPGQSILIIQQTDPFTHTGTCYDSFWGITASNYYTIFYKNFVKSDPIRFALSQRSCSDLSFSGGLENITSEGFRMKIYQCGHHPRACSSTAIKEVGLKSPL